MREIKIIRATGAAIITSAGLPPEIAAQIADTTPKFVVHPYVADVEIDDPLLLSYVHQIYSSKTRPLGSAYPGGSEFAKLASESTVKSGTEGLARALAMEMSKKKANAGILFGFILDLGDGARAHGVIKADLEHEDRFHMLTHPDGGWSLGRVSELLPRPRAEYAKFVIAPQPGGDAAAGVRDVTDAESAAAYFLAAIDLSVPKVAGTQATLAKAALKVGYTHEEIRVALQPVATPTPVAQVVREKFERIPPRDIERLAGRPERPMPNVIPDDPYVRVYKTRSPLFELSVDDRVEVMVEGRVITVTLPEDSEEIVESARER